MQRRSEEDFKEATSWLKKAIEVRSSFAEAYKALGVTYWKHFDAEDALTNFYAANRYDANDADTFVNMARVYLELKNNNQGAIGCLKKAIEIKPSFAEAYSLLGVAHNREGNIDEAIKQTLKAIEIDPKYYQAYLDLGSIYRDHKNYPEALRSINKAIEITPDDYRPYKELAKLYESQQKSEEAINNYQEATKNLKIDVPWVRNLFLCRIERLRAHYAAAIGCFQQITSADQPGLISYEIGATYVASKNKKAALAEYEKLKQIRSSLADDLFRLIHETN
jgi:tetratricopeptide (TPR) repeat protein